MVTWVETLKRESAELESLAENLLAPARAKGIPRWFLATETMIRASRLRSLARRFDAVGAHRWGDRVGKLVNTAMTAVDRARRGVPELDEEVETSLPNWVDEGVRASRALEGAVDRTMEFYWMMEKRNSIAEWSKRFGWEAPRELSWRGWKFESYSSHDRDALGLQIRNYRTARLMVSDLGGDGLTRELDWFSGKIGAGPTPLPAEFLADYEALRSLDPDLAGTVSGVVGSMLQLLSEVHLEAIRDLVRLGWRRPLGSANLVGEPPTHWLAVGLVSRKAGVGGLRAELAKLEPSLRENRRPRAVVLFTDTWNDLSFMREFAHSWRAASAEGVRFFVFLAGKSVRVPTYLRVVA